MIGRPGLSSGEEAHQLACLHKIQCGINPALVASNNQEVITFESAPILDSGRVNRVMRTRESVCARGKELPGGPDETRPPLRSCDEASAPSLRNRHPRKRDEFTRCVMISFHKTQQPLNNVSRNSRIGARSRRKRDRCPLRARGGPCLENAR